MLLRPEPEEKKSLREQEVIGDHAKMCSPLPKMFGKKVKLTPTAIVKLKNAITALCGFSVSMPVFANTA